MNTRVLLLVSGAALVVAAALSAWAWIEVPGSTVVGGIGSDLRDVSKLRGLVFGPFLFLGIPIAIFLAIPRIEPRRGHLLASSKAYSAIWVTVIAAGLIAHVAFVIRAIGRSPDLSENLIQLTLPLFMIVAGNYMSKVRSNYFLGFQTPWTLSSEQAWRKTHRLGGRLSMLAGAALIPLAFVLDWWKYFWTAGAITFAVLIAVVVYSHVMWRKETKTP